MLIEVSTAASLDIIGQELSHADYQAQTGWLGEALTHAHRAATESTSLLGAEHEATAAVQAFATGIREDHYDPNTTEYDTTRLRALYLTARGALAVAAEN